MKSHQIAPFETASTRYFDKLVLNSAEFDDSSSANETRDFCCDDTNCLPTRIHG